MDETRLVDSLRQKLDELEREVEACRSQLLAEFHHHCRLLLRDVAPDAASEVKRVLAASFASYPALRPELDADSPRAACPPRPRPPPPSPSPPPPPTISAAAFQSAASGRPQRARQRDLELRGLFTPSYLPLLDDDSPVSPSLARAPASGTVPDPPLPLDGGSGHAAMDQTGHHRAALQPVPPLFVPDPPADTARATDDTRSSISSDKSDSKPPRSALRRSSSISKAPQSPRRVRFEFMGAEVLPTTSPQPSGSLRCRPSPPGPDPDDPAAFASNLGADMAEEDRVPPRKVSSDALRALSRTPREEGVGWTVVNADVDQAAPDRQPVLPATPPTATPTPPKTTHGSIPAKTFAPTQSSTETPIADAHDQDDDHDSSSDDGFLAMPKARSSVKTPSQPSASAPKAPIIPPLGGAKTPASPTSRQSPRPSSAEGEHHRTIYDDDTEVDDDDDMFHFETGGPTAVTKSRSSPRPASREQDMPEPSETDDDEPNALETQTQEQQTSSYATSPAVPIRQSWGSRPWTASGVKFRPGSVGSYKGQSLMMPIVRDPEILAQAGSLGSSELRVDGVDDQTAMEDGSPPRFPSTPFSFKERFMMEEMMERAKSNKDERGG